MLDYNSFIFFEKFLLGVMYFIAATNYVFNEGFSYDAIQLECIFYCVLSYIFVFE